MNKNLWRTIAAGGAALAVPGLASAHGVVVTDVDTTDTGTVGETLYFGFSLNLDGTFTVTGGGTGDIEFDVSSNQVDFEAQGTGQVAADSNVCAINFLDPSQVGPSASVYDWQSQSAATLDKPPAEGGGDKGNFAQVSDGWVGFRIPTDNSYTSFNYGAVEVSNVNIDNAPASLTVDQIDFNTTPDQAVGSAVPEPSTFALLALGAAGLAALRKRRKA